VFAAFWAADSLDTRLFFFKKKGWISLKQKFYIQPPDRALLKERKITNEFTEGAPRDRRRRRPLLPQARSSPPPAMKKTQDEVHGQIPNRRRVNF